MTTPRRRNKLATGAFLYLRLLASAALLLASAGCSTFHRGGSASLPPSPSTEPRLVAPAHVELGHILSYDAADATAVIEFVPHYRDAPFLADAKLIARDRDTLAPTARLVGAPYQSGRVLGAYVTSGRPRVGDEVVIAPPEPDVSAP